MSRRTALDHFRSRQARMQLLTSTVSPAVVLLKTGRADGPAAALECRFRVRASSGTHYDVRLREHWGFADSAPSLDWYSYSIAQADGPEVLSYHLHPSHGSYEANHLHLSGGSGQLISELLKSHLPTGSVSLPAFVQLLVNDFAVRTIRSDWREVLASQVTDP